MKFLLETFSLSYPSSKDRIALYDFLRGFAMILVLLQHAVMPGWKYLCAFHMALFFYLSGLVSGGKELPSFGKYFRSKFMRLMIPYFAFGVFDVLWYSVFFAVTHKEYSVLKGIIGVFAGQFEPWGGIGVYWFLYALFVAYMIVWPVKKLAKDCRLAQWGGVLLFFGLSYFTTYTKSASLFCIDKALFAAAFIMIGDLSKSLVNSIIELKPKILDFILLNLGIIGLWLAMKYNDQTVLVYVNQFGDYGWMVVGAFSGIITTLVIGKYLFMLLEGRYSFIYNLVMWVGFNSLVLFPVHLEIKNTIGKLMGHFGIGYWWLVFAAMLMMGIPICNFITHYLPWFLGNFKK